VPDDCAYSLAEPHELESGEWSVTVAGRGQVRSADGATITLIGDCPRCHHQMSVELPIQARTGDTIAPGPEDPGYKDRPDTSKGQQLRRGKDFVKVAVCNCGTAHADQPDACSGCGAFGALQVGRPDDHPKPSRPGTRHVSVIGLPNKAAIHDVAWERKAETEADQTLANARSAAEKWTQTVASLTGVFSIVLLVKGPEDLSNAGGTVDVPNVPNLLTLSALVIAAVVVLAAIAKAAKGYPPWMRWRALLIAAIVSIFVLVVDWADDYWKHRTLIIVLLGAAARWPQRRSSPEDSRPSGCRASTPLPRARFFDTVTRSRRAPRGRYCAPRSMRGPSRSSSWAPRSC
jgi:hypothetical protein